MTNRFFHIPKLYLFYLLLFFSPISHAELATELFDAVRDKVYQVRIIDLASSDKYSIGSGFKIDDGHVATNFHVISAYAHEPDKYRIELLLSDNTKVTAAELVAFDVIHDLAILNVDLTHKEYLPLSSTNIEQGDRIFSMGNPRDLGMSIVEGTYNGLVPHSRYQKILFSGSLNPGMSGGPAFNSNGEVIGINVSTGGDQISFLVPVRELKSLIENHQTSGDLTNFDEEITQSLLHDQESFYNNILSSEFTMETLGELMIPIEIDDSLRCWGHTQDDDDQKYKAVHQHCRSEDRIYIEDSFFVGSFAYDLEWIETESLNPSQFYTFLESRFYHRALRYRGEKVATKFSCHTDFVEIDNIKWKMSACLSEYKKYQGLHDMTLIMVSIDKKDRASLASINASPISKENAMNLMDTFMASIKWKN